MAATERKIQPGDKRFYKGIYPVKVIKTADETKEHLVQAECPFLDISNYSDEKKPVRAGETFTTKGSKLWPQPRKVGR